MLPRFDLSERRFGRLVVVEFDKKIEDNNSWLCVCDCGAYKRVFSNDLKRGVTQSCGCLQRERTAEANRNRIRHGHTRVSEDGKSRLTTPTYRSWKAMLERCRNANAPNYPLYGGRGIKVCKRWQGKTGFANFLADMGERPDGMTIDRVNCDGDYKPSNCRWADAKGQSNNRRTTPAVRAMRKKNLANGRKYWPRKDST